MKSKILIALVVLVGIPALAALYVMNEKQAETVAVAAEPETQSATQSAPEPAGACVLKGELVYKGETYEINDCMRNDGLAPDVFKGTCEWVVEYSASLGGRPDLSYAASCPGEAKGACDTFFGRPITVFYYRSNPDEMAKMKSGCEMQKGRWTEDGSAPAQAASAQAVSKSQQVSPTLDP